MKFSPQSGRLASSGVVPLDLTVVRHRDIKNCARVQQADSDLISIIRVCNLH